MAKVADIKHLEHFSPNSSSGTGYCQYEIYELVLDNKTSKKISIPHWYTPLSEELNIMEEEIGKLSYISNQVETYRKLKEIWIKNHYKEEGYKLIPK